VAKFAVIPTLSRGERGCSSRQLYQSGQDRHQLSHLLVEVEATLTVVIFKIEP